MIYAISCLSMKRHSVIFTFPSLAKLAVSLRAWTQLSILRNATPTDVISQYDYTYDAAGRRIEIARSGTAMSESRTDAYGYNTRNELTSATKTGGPASVPASPEYAYQYDDIGNRITSTDLTTNRTYTANNLNQYTSISSSASSALSAGETFTPQYDDDGNQTLIQTSTGIWQVQYNGENRPVLWTGGTQSAMTNIVMSFDRMGRRVEYLETAGGSQSSATETNAYHCFLYDNYLCIQRLDAANGNTVDLAFVWDVTEPIATRPLIIDKPEVCKACMTHDGNKNVVELISDNYQVVAHYEYTPFGDLAVATQTTSAQSVNLRTCNPFRFSSEYSDDILGLIYYNFRHYVPDDGRWSCLDIIEDVVGKNLYSFVDNFSMSSSDYLGLKQIGDPVRCGSCLVCLDNDSGSGDGNSYKIHWRCGIRGRPPSTCRASSKIKKSGSAHFPSWKPSHGSSETLEKIKDCIRKSTKWEEKVIKVREPLPNFNCCREVEYKTYVPSLSATTGYSYDPQRNYALMNVVTCVGIIAIFLLIPIGI